jgi:hypothetical protein
MALHRAFNIDTIPPSGSTKVMILTEDNSQFAYATINSIQSPLDVAGLATDADITALQSQIGVSGSYSSQDKYYATNNGNGTNYKVGDDAWIGDVNVSNTIQVSGVQNAATGYIKFASGSNTPVIGSSGVNRLNIKNIPTYANNAAALAGGLVAGDIYIYTASDFLAIVH